jgi:excisionase family DNA binding protein
MDVLAYTISEACASTRTGKTALYAAIHNGELRAVKRGRRTLILVSDLEEWLSRLPSVEPKTTNPQTPR